MPRSQVTLDQFGESGRYQKQITEKHTNLTKTIIGNAKAKIDELETTYSSQHEVQHEKVNTQTLLGISSGMINDIVWALIQWEFNMLATLGTIMPSLKLTT